MYAGKIFQEKSSTKRWQEILKLCQDINIMSNLNTIQVTKN